jgi:signal transduction histidine kinase/ligand-binding sensor domain-containing protein
VLWRNIAFVCLWVASGWALDPNRALTQYQHRIWQTQQGLPLGAIRSIWQTSDGYLWLGMDRGLVRFDGVRFSAPGEILATPLVTAHIRQIAEDANQNLWVATNGAGLFRLSHGEAAEFSLKDGLPSDKVTCVVRDRTGGILACTEAGMARIDNGSVQIFATGTGFAAACQAPDGTIWAGGQGNNLTLWSGAANGQAPEARTIMLRTLPPFADVQALMCASDGSVWIGSTEGLSRIENGNQETSIKDPGRTHDSVLSFDEAPDGTIWIGTSNGFSRFRNGELQNFGAQDGLSQSIVFSVYQDREGSLWVGTKRGLNQFLDRRAIPFTTREGLPSNDTGPVFQDAEGKLWVGLLDAGLARLDKRQWRVIGRAEGLSSGVISALAQGTAGGLWVGGDSGLDLLVNGRVKQSYHTGDGLPANAIRSLFPDREGTLWIGTESGAAVLRNGRIERLSGAAAKRSPVLAFAEDSQGHVYVGVQDAGVSCYWERSLGEITGKRIALRNVDAMYTADGALFVGTIGGGLAVIEGGKSVSITEDNGLYDDDIYGIVADDQGRRLWMACSKGVFSVERAELEKFRSGLVKQVSSSTYSPMDGLQTMEVRSGVQPALWRMRDGRLCISMIRGLIVLDPDHFNLKLDAPQVSIENMTVDGRRITAASLRQMSPGSKNLAFAYTGLSFRAPQRITFRYILEGFDKRWTEANTRRQAFYTNLPPGSYRFRVTACNVDGTCNEAGAALSFHIPAPLYQRAWFLVACVLMAMLAAILAYRTRIEGIRRQFEMILGERSRIARELHDTLIQGFSGVTMQMQALAGRLTAQERKALEEIIRDAAYCLTETRRSVGDLRARQTGESGLASEIERLGHHAAEAGGFKLKVHVDRVPPELPAGVEYNLVRIAQEALANAMNHSQGQSIKLILRYRRNALGLSIVDDGMGFEPGAGANPFPGHYGLIGMRERARDIGAEFTIESARGRGTAVRVAVPLSGRPAAAETAKAMGD